MTEDLTICPSCGLEVPIGKYCKYCGEPLSLEKTIEEDDFLERTTDTSDSAPVEDDAISKEMDVYVPDFGFYIDGMDPRDMALLFAKSELDVLDKQLDELIEQIRATRHALDLKHADKDLLVSRAQSLKEQLEATKARRHDLRKVHGTLPIKRIFDELEAQESKLSKLEEIEKKLDPEVFEEEKTRILIRIRDLRRDLKTAIKSSKSWLKSMAGKLKEIQKERSRLEAKLKIGDISTPKYDSTKFKLDKYEAIILGGQKMLDEITTLASKK